MKEKKYSVIHTTYAGMIGIDVELSKHSSRAAAFRALHKYEKEYGKGLSVIDENGNHLFEVKTKRNGRWVTI